MSAVVNTHFVISSRIPRNCCVTWLHRTLLLFLCGAPRAAIGGGCLSLAEKSRATVAGSNLDSNFAATEGGAVRVSGLSAAALSGCTVQGNAAQWGAAFWTEMESVLNITNTTVSNNVASFQVRYRRTPST